MSAATVALLRSVGRVATPWKNGLGATMEIARDPPGEGFTAFDWRVSRAEFDRDSAFSTFPGIDRTLVVLSGELELQVANLPSVRLGTSSAPHRFDGELPASARVLQPPIVDLNVMTTRGRAHAAVARILVSGTHSLAIEADVALLYVAAGRSHVSVAEQDYGLTTDDALCVPRAVARRLSMQADTAVLLCISIARHPQPPRANVRSS